MQYGRSFTLKDPSCNTPNGVCQFSGGANAGPCSNTVGILDYQEIQDVISNTNVKPVWDKTAGVKWITWDNDQWISYDDSDTFAQKKVCWRLDHAERICVSILIIAGLCHRQVSGRSYGVGHRSERSVVIERSRS
jgi:hypothetical protein